MTPLHWWWWWRVDSFVSHSSLSSGRTKTTIVALCLGSSVEGLFQLKFTSQSGYKTTHCSKAACGFSASNGYCSQIPFSVGEIMRECLCLRFFFCETKITPHPAKSEFHCLFVTYHLPINILLGSTQIYTTSVVNVNTHA